MIVIRLDHYFPRRSDFVILVRPTIKFIGESSSLFDRFRSLACTKTHDIAVLLESHEVYRNPNSIRHGSIMLRNGVLAAALIYATGIYWKKKRTFIPARSQHNLITLNQTVLFVILINLDGMISYLLHPNDQSHVFVLELLKMIFIENILFKCLVPVYLLLSSRRHYAILWNDRKPEKCNFFMTQPSFVARPVISKFKNKNNENSVLEPEVKEIFQLRNSSRRPAHIIVTVHAPSDQGCSVARVEN